MQYRRSYRITENDVPEQWKVYMENRELDGQLLVVLDGDGIRRIPFTIRARKVRQWKTLHIALFNGEGLTADVVNNNEVSFNRMNRPWIPVTMLNKQRA